MNKPASELIALPSLEEMMDAQEILSMCKPIHADQGGMWFGRNYNIADARFVDHGACRAFEVAARALPLAIAADALREALKPFAKMAGAMYVSGHCGGASPEDWPDRWHVTVQGGKHFHTPQQHGGYLTVADFRRAAEALATPPEQPAPASGEKSVTCERCQGNGEIVTDWDSYLHPANLAAEQASVAECPDCDGEGTHGEPDGAVREIFQNNLREAWSALAMIRETVETLGPVGAMQASEHLDGPTFMHEAEEIIAGIAALHSPKIAAAETSPGDVLAQLKANIDTRLNNCLCEMKPGYDDSITGFNEAWDIVRKAFSAAIDRLDVKAEAKSQEPDAVAFGMYDTQMGRSARLMMVRLCNGQDGCDVPLYTHPTTKPEAPAVSVDAIARALLRAKIQKYPGSFGMDRSEDFTVARIERHVDSGWQNHLWQATAIAALIAGER